MAKTRITIPKGTREKVLAEFHYRCAKCGADRPQIHHIDENPSNNDLLNLIPLCPSCHLTDQHNPTNPIEPKKLSLLRKYKDPSVLGPQFHALFVRLSFLDEALENAIAEDLNGRAADLVAFIEQLEMGSYYAKKIKGLVQMRQTVAALELDLDSGEFLASHEFERREREYNEQYIQQLRAAYDPVHALVIELLRFQKW